MQRFPLEQHEVRLITAIGFLAAGAHRVSLGGRIFGALVALRPHRAFGYIGWAMTYLNGGRTEEAVTVLERATALVPSERKEERTQISAFLGFALQLAGRPDQARRVLRDAAEGSSVVVVRFAQRLLGMGDEPRSG
jgi:hypothetical protein